MLRIARHLKNWEEVWRGYMHQRPLPELHFRSGLRFAHASGDAPVFLLFEVFADGCYRRHTRGPMEGTILDIGANIGAAALDFASRYDRLEIHSYEPNPKSLGMLRHNVSINGFADKILYFQEAVGIGCGTLRLDVAGPSIAATAYGSMDGAEADYIDLPCVGLAECMTRVTKLPVALLKLDAEGAEADILEGAPPGILDCVRNVALEYHNDLCEQADHRCEAVLRGAGFKVLRTTARPPRGLIHAWR